MPKKKAKVIHGKYEDSDWKNEKPTLDQFGLQPGEYTLIKKKYKEYKSNDGFHYSPEIERREKISGKSINLKLYYTAFVIGIIIIAFFDLRIMIHFVQTEETMGMKALSIFAIGFAGLLAVSFFHVFLEMIDDALYDITKPSRKKTDKMKKAEEEAFQRARDLEYAEWIEKNEKVKAYDKAMKEYRYWTMRRTYEFWDNLDGNQFEIEVARLLSDMGFKAKVQPIGPDGGVDIIATKGPLVYAVQCKAYHSKIPVSVARDLYGVLHSGDYTGGYLFALNGVTQPTRQFCNSIFDKRIEIWDIEDIVNYLEKKQSDEEEAIFMKKEEEGMEEIISEDDAYDESNIYDEEIYNDIEASSHLSNEYENNTVDGSDEDKPLISWEDAKKHFGETITICGPVVSVPEKLEGIQKYIDIGEKWPSKDRISLVIWEEDMHKFQDIVEIEGEMVNVTGKIEEYKGVAQIVVRDKKQLQKANIPIS